MAPWHNRVMAIRRSPHPGVKIVRRQRPGGESWLGRVQQADGSWRELSLERLGLRSARDRRLWAQRQSEAIQDRKRAGALGLPCSSGTPLAEAAQRYLADVKARLRGSSEVAYRRASDRLLRWLGSRGVGVAESLSPETLWAYREWLVGRGWKPATLATALRMTVAQVTWWRRAGFVPGLTQDAIKDRLRQPRVDFAPPAAYTPGEIQALIRSALERGWEPATTVVLYLLLGLRASELRLLTWDRVLLDAPPAGEVRIGVESKTRTARVVDLSITPGARLLLRSLPRRSPRVCPWMRSAANQRWARQQIAGPAGWTWQALREVSASYQVCAPSVWGGSSAYRTARQLGHSVVISERHYMGLLRGIPESARTLEAAMGIEAEVAMVASACMAAR